MVTICTTSLRFNSSTFCPHTVFMCFVWISEQTAIIFLYSINWLVLITETPRRISHCLEYGVPSLGVWFPTFRDYVSFLSRRVKSSRIYISFLDFHPWRWHTYTASKRRGPESHWDKFTFLGDGYRIHAAAKLTVRTELQRSPGVSYCYEAAWVIPTLVSVLQLSTLPIKFISKLACLQQKLCAQYLVAVWRHGVSPGLWYQTVRAVICGQLLNIGFEVFPIWNSNGLCASYRVALYRAPHCVTFCSATCLPGNCIHQAWYCHGRSDV